MNESDPAEEIQRLHEEAAGKLVLGEKEQAEQLLLQALRLAEERLPPGHLTLAAVLSSLGELRASEKKYAEAESYSRRAVQVWEWSLGPESPEVASGLLVLGKLYAVTGKASEAEPLLKRAVGIREQNMGAGHPQTAGARATLASLYKNQGRDAEAADLLRQAQASIADWMAPVFSGFENAVAEFRDADLSPEQCAAMEPEVRRGLELTQRLVGPDHPVIAAHLENLATLLRKMGRPAEAGEAEERAKSIREKHR